MKARAAAVLVLVVGALLATAVATAEPSAGAQGGHFSRPSSVADAAKWLTPSVRAEIEAKGIAAATANPSVPVTVTFAGFAYCGNDVVVEYPAYDSTHQSTITVPVIVFATQANFSDAKTDIPPWYLIQSGTQFIYHYTNGNPDSGPWDYWNAWTEDLFSAQFPPDHPYVEVANAVWTMDNGQVTGPDIRIVQALGPNVTGSPVCHL